MSYKAYTYVHECSLRPKNSWQYTDDARFNTYITHTSVCLSQIASALIFDVDLFRMHKLIANITSCAWIRIAIANNSTKYTRTDAHLAL